MRLIAAGFRLRPSADGDLGAVECDQSVQFRSDIDGLDIGPGRLGDSLAVYDDIEVLGVTLEWRGSDGLWMAFLTRVTSAGVVMSRMVGGPKHAHRLGECTCAWRIDPRSLASVGTDPVEIVQYDSDWPVAYDAAAAELNGQIFVEELAFDGGRTVAAYMPPDAADAVVYAADGGWHIERLARALEDAGRRSTAIVGVHGLDDDDARLHEYVESFGGDRFRRFERFVVEEVRVWAESVVGASVPADQTAVWGASLGAEFALAMGLRHPELYNTVLCASPGGGLSPTNYALPLLIERAYFVGGTGEAWFLDNARRWADALRNAGADVVLHERDGEHGGTFWYDEFPLMVSWAGGR